MKVIDIHQFNDFTNHDAILFTKEGIIVDRLTQSPCIKFLSATKKLGLTINTVYLDGTLLIALCQLSAPFANQCTVYPVKNFLTMTQENSHGQILRAIHWLTWDEKLQYCSKCGDTLNTIPDLMEKRCNACGSSFFPNLAPAVMVLVQKEQQILLARSAHFKPGMYSVLAGFIGIGETAESAVHREIFEEVSIEVSNVAYFGSQSWPFPNSFMMAFKANYASGKLTLDPNEIEDAKWFEVDNLPVLPAYPSLSRQLIDSWRLSHPP